MYGPSENVVAYVAHPIEVDANATDSTLTATVSGGTATNYTWGKTIAVDGHGETIADGPNETSIAIPATVSNPYFVEVSFEGLQGKLTCWNINTQKVNQIPGATLTGGLLTSNDGAFHSGSSPEYTITLPEGYQFKKSVNGENIPYYQLQDDYGVYISGLSYKNPDSSNYTSGIEDCTFNVNVNQNSLTYKFTNFKNHESPLNQPMEVAATVYDPSNNLVTNHFPTNDIIGFKIQVPASSDQIELISPKGPRYANGNPVTAIVAAKENEYHLTVNDVGTISNIRYVPVGGDVESALSEAPRVAGTYDVYCNVEGGTRYSAANNVKAGTFTIFAQPINPEASLYTMNPAETDYTGQAQEPTITPNTGAGSVKAVHYYAKDSETELEGKPTDAGEYTVKIDTNPSNTYNAATNLTLGTYKIKQVTLTDDNAKNFFDFSPKSAVYDAKDQTTTVSLKSGITKAGDINVVSFKKNDGFVTPKAVGTYDVYVTTKTDESHSDANVKATETPVKIGTFTITEKSSGGGSSTKTEPTKALYTMDPVKAEYDGKTHKPAITPKSGAGEVDKVRYYLDGKAITGEPKDAGIYTVKIDTKENDTYAAKTELELGTFEITKGKPTKELYTMTPAEAEVSDQAQKPTITPAEGAGAVEKVHYYLDGKEITGEPKDVGTYVVKIDTKENDNYKAEKELEIGNFIIKEKAPDQAVAYSAHVQNVDWQPYVTNGTMAGTVDRSLRMEAVKINLQHQKYKGDIEYRSHIENIGWEKEWKKNDTMSGTNSKGLRLEAMQVRLTGEMAEHYDVYYRVHAQNIGWMNWAKNGEQAGTAGYGYRLEAMQIMLVDKDGAVPNIAPNAQTDKRFTEKYKDNVKEDSLVVYQTHVQNVGWQDYSVDGSDAGTDHQSLRLEGVKMYLNNPKYDGDIEYRTHIENIGWENEWKKNNAMSGTSGRSLRLEAMQVRLTGEMAKHYDVYYRVHAQNIGWMNWAKNGEQAGTAGYAYRLEAMQVVLVEKDGAAPALAPNSDTDQAFAQK